MAKLSFQHHNPHNALSVVSHDPSEIILIYWFAAQETFLIIINVENSCAIFVQTVIHILSGFCDAYIN